MAALLAAVFATTATATPPEVETKAATNIGLKIATLNATIKTGGKGASYAFEYGLTESYGSYTEAKLIPSGESGPVEVSAALEGLEIRTDYHFRIWTWDFSNDKIVSGKDVTFKTENGLYLTGEESKEEANQPKVEATEYPWINYGRIKPGTAFKLFESKNGQVAQCSSGLLFNFWESFKAPTSTFSITPLSFGECTMAGSKATVNMNGCYYVHKLANSGPPYTGSVAIACKEAGNKIKIESAFCSVNIPAQSLGGSTAYKEGYFPGHGAGIEVGTAAEGLTFEKVGGTFCFLISGTTEGKFGGTIELI